MDQSMKEVDVTPEALSVVREIKTVLIDQLREETRLKPVYTNEMSKARFPNDPNIQSFLRGPRRTKKIALNGDLADAHQLAAHIQMACFFRTGFSMSVSVGGRDDSSFITLTKTTKLHDGEMENYEDCRRMLEELLKEREEAAPTAKTPNDGATPTVSPLVPLSETSEPPGKRAKLADK